MARTRFAPSPTGRLHLGHALAAVWAWRAGGGTMVLRMEDLDSERSHPDHEAGILEDLEWLGLSWEEPVVRQSERTPIYAAAIAKLDSLGLVYPCFCSRRQVAEQVAAMAGAPHEGEAVRYPGTCRTLSPEERLARLERDPIRSVRLDASAALARFSPLWSSDRAGGRIPVEASAVDDVPLARLPSGEGAAYHLAVVVDDADQGISLVTRGGDLRDATSVQRVIQAALGLSEPEYWHHPLVRDEAGRRLAKRSAGAELAVLREAGVKPGQAVQLALLGAGLAEADLPKM